MVLNLILSFFLSFTNVTPTAVKPMACNSKAFTDLVIKKLPKGYTFLKAYPIDGRQGQRKLVRFSYIFSKNSTYTIRIKNSSPKNEGLIVKVLDSRKKVKVSSYARGRYYSGLNYKCSATGIYYITFQFDGKGDYCAGGVLAFKR
ncbi:hypothetical protein BKI52_34000 [marine bacterium AO1-C]|nr:hypothetical protein BKI52_34000 [marine bacterium AO1-C]